MKYKIAVLDNINLLSEAEDKLKSIAVDRLRFYREPQVSEQEMITRTGKAEAVLVSILGKITESYLTASSTVKYIGLCGTSMANIDLEAIKKHKVVLTNVADYGDEPAAEYMFMLLLMLARGQGKFQWQEMSTELMGKSIGIIGLGALGRAVAKLALGFKMKVYYHSLHRKTDWEKRGLKYLNLKALLKACDVIVISTPTNIKVLGKEEFGVMRKGSVLMYLSSGEGLDKRAFVGWIKKKKNFALFNYSAGEGYYQAFKDLPNVIFPKVIAGYTRETKMRLGQKVVDNLINYFSAII